MKTEIVGNAPELRDSLPELSGQKFLLQALFNSPESMADAVGNIRASDCWTRAAWDSDSNRGTYSMQEAIDLAKAGWPQGGARAAKLRDRINAEHPTGPRLVRWDVAGAYPSVQRALAGDVLNMRRIDTTRLRRRPVIALVSDAAVGWSTPADRILNRAAVVAAIVDAVESKGYACEVLSVFHSQDNGFAWRHAVKVKESHAPVDIGRVAFGVGHPALLRRFMFAFCDGCRDIQRIGGALGIPQATTPQSERGVYVLDSLTTRRAILAFSSEDSAASAGLELLVSSLRAQGCPAFPAETP